MTRDEAEKLRLSGDNWWLGFIYACSKDPRVVVRNRHGFGWTWNFGHPWAIPLIAATIIMFVGGYYYLALVKQISGTELLLAAIAAVAILGLVVNAMSRLPRC